MLLWEVSSFNKLFKSGVFYAIRPRLKGFQTIFVLSAPERSASSSIKQIQTIDRVLAESDKFLENKYTITESNSKVSYSALYLYDCLLVVAYENQLLNKFQLEEFRVWAYKAFLFSNCKEVNFNERVGELDKELSAKTSLINSRITVADILVISGIKRNPFHSIIVPKFINVKRWMEWVQGLLGIE